MLSSIICRNGACVLCITWLVSVILYLRLVQSIVLSCSSPLRWCSVSHFGYASIFSFFRPMACGLDPAAALCQLVCEPVLSGLAVATWLCLCFGELSTSPVARRLTRHLRPVFWPTGLQWYRFVLSSRQFFANVPYHQLQSVWAPSFAPALHA